MKDKTIFSLTENKLRKAVKCEMVNSKAVRNHPNRRVKTQPLYHVKYKIKRGEGGARKTRITRLVGTACTCIKYY